MNAPAFGELEIVRLKFDLTTEVKLCAGTTGAIVQVHGEGQAYDVEVADQHGNTVAVLTLRADLLEATGKTDP